MNALDSTIEDLKRAIICLEKDVAEIKKHIATCKHGQKEHAASKCACGSCKSSSPCSRCK